MSHRCVGLRTRQQRARKPSRGGGGDEEVVTSFGSSSSSGDYCSTLLTARVFIAAAFLDVGKVSQDALDELVRNAPKEIRADVRALAQALATFTEEVGDDPDALEINAALESLPETAAAEKRLDAWQEEHCKGNG